MVICAKPPSHTNTDAAADTDCSDGQLSVEMFCSS